MLKREGRKGGIWFLRNEKSKKHATTKIVISITFPFKYQPAIPWPGKSALTHENGICTEFPDLKRQELMKNYQIYSECWAASVALSDTINIPVFGIRKLLEIFPSLSAFGQINTCKPEPGGGGSNQVHAGTKSGTQGFESLASVIKNWLKIAWSILLASQKYILITNLRSVH